MYSVYQPAATAIDYAAARAKHNFPDWTARIDLAVVILADLTNRVCLAEDGAWVYHNPRDTTYRVDPTGCTCPNYTHHRGGPDRYYCKHLLAYYGWRRILIEALKCYANPDGICDLRYSSHGELIPATPVDFALVSHYLATGRNYRPPVYHAEPLETTAPTTEWQPSPITRRWLATGEVIPPLTA
jgi:hypothetical protein